MVEAFLFKHKKKREISQANSICFKMSATKLKFGKVVYTTINITQHMITCSAEEL